MAIKDSLRKVCSIREAARRYGIKRDTLQSRINKIKKNGKEHSYLESDSGAESDDGATKYSSKYTVRQVFTVFQEEDLVRYIMLCSDLNYGLSYRQIRNLAYDYAKSLNCKFPDSWNANQTAGKDWLTGFMARHPTLSLRKPGSTSLLRSTAFNKDRVTEFFDNYVQVLERFQFKPERIYSLDETGITTVMRAIKVVSRKGKKQVGQVASSERGELVTFVGIINADGGKVPPVYIFPRVRQPEGYLTDSPSTRCLVLGNKSGWMTKELFPLVLSHIAEYTNCFVNNRILLLVDNHESHTSLEAIKLCRSVGITLLSFPPHTTHRLQPLDVGVYGPFKAALAVAFGDWLLSHPGRAITIRNIGELSKKAYQNSFTETNIRNSFSKPGIWPFNRLAFCDDDFVASSVTDMEKGSAMSQKDGNLSTVDATPLREKK